MILRSRIQIALAGLTAVLVMAAGCGDRVPTGVDLRPEGGLKVGSVAHVLALPSRGHIGQNSRIIDARGGSVDFGIGRVVFPAGALARPTLITAVTANATRAVTFSPHGLVFPAEAQPELHLKTSGIPTPFESLRIIYVNPNGYIAEILPTAIDVSTGTAVSAISHFSTYAMGSH
jgi:hypothetical protein